jgi:HEAT repeat protein
VVEAVGDLRDERALAGLCGALQDRAATVRKAALSALRRLGHPGSVGSLVERLDDKNAGIRRAAAGALRELGWSAATPDAAARLAFAQQDWYALRKMGPDALPVLHDNLGDAELSVRMESVRILGRMGYATSLPALRDRLRRWGGGERDPDVRERIREATIAIERVVRHTRQLPIPGEPAAATTDQLPIPAASEPKVPGADPPLGR